MEAFDLRLDILSGRGQVIDASGAVDPPRDQLGIACDQAEDIDILQEPHIVIVRADREAPLVVLRHQQQRLEHEVVEVDRDDVEAAGFPHRGLERTPEQNDRFRQVHPGHDADTMTIPHEEGVDVVVPHAVASLLDADPSIDVYRGTIPYVAHPRAQHAVHALRLPLPCESVELAGYVRIKERREGGVAVDQAVDDVARDEMAERLFGRHEIFARGPVHEGAGVEAVFRPKHGRDRAAVPDLHGSLDHDMQPVRGASLGDDHLFGREVPDVEPGSELLALLMRQAVERWIGGVEALHGVLSASTEPSPPGLPGDDICCVVNGREQPRPRCPFPIG